MRARIPPIACFFSGLTVYFESHYQNRQENVIMTLIIILKFCMVSADRSLGKGDAMYICLCFGVSDKTVKNLVKEGAQTVRDVQKSCSAGRDCGACLDRIKKVVREESSGGSFGS